MTVARRGFGLVVLVLEAAAGCRRAAPPPVADSTPAPSATPSDLRPLAPEALARYREAQRHVAAGDLDAAQTAFEAAVAAQPDFTEGWYNLGATYSNQAVREAGQGRDLLALQSARQGVAAKTRARDLMNADVWFLYDASQRGIVRHDVALALVDAEAVLAEPDSLIVALRLRARGVRHPAE